MRILRTKGEIRAHVRAARAGGRAVGLVPTMGALHEGHLALVRAARDACDEVVVSLFVNPAQFDDAGDLAAYPRDEARDALLAAEAGADVLWAPDAAEVYPEGFATTVSIGGALTAALEGEHRGRAHFDGVATVVLKLLNVVAPDAAFFGAKDAQQVVVVRRMVADLDVPVRIEVVPTVREPDGLARSSRNVHLSPADRERAVALHAALRAAQDAADAGERDAARLLAAARRRMDGVRPDYLALVDPSTLAPVAALDRPALLAVAARVGPTRLIDNALITPSKEP